MAESEEYRFRSYAERYVVARAANFRVGHEDEDAWQATLEAQGAYKRIAEVAKGFRDKEDGAASAGQGQMASQTTTAGPYNFPNQPPNLGQVGSKVHTLLPAPVR